MSVGANIYNRMLLDMARPHTDPKLRNNQNGYRKGRSTVAQILTLRRPAIVTFADFRKAFDSIHSGKLMEIMRAYGVSVEIAEAVNMMCTNTTVQVLSPDGDTKFLEILAGVLLEDILAPSLFIFALDYAMRQVAGTTTT